MTDPEFRVLPPEELAKLSPEARVEYRKKLIEQMQGQIADTNAAIEARNNRFGKPD